MNKILLEKCYIFFFVYSNSLLKLLQINSNHFVLIVYSDLKEYPSELTQKPITISLLGSI